MIFNAFCRTLAAVTAATAIGILLLPRRELEQVVAKQDEVDRWEGEGGNVPSIPPPYAGPQPSEIPAPEHPLN